MSTPDTILMTQGLSSVQAPNVLITVNGTQATLAVALETFNGGTITGTVTNSGTISGGAVNPATETVGSNVVSPLVNFASIVPAGSNLATATAINAKTVQLGVAASTTGVYISAASFPTNDPIAMVNSGTAAIHVYGSAYTIDTIAGTTGVTLTNGFGCLIVPTGTASAVTTCRGTVAS